MMLALFWILALLLFCTVTLGIYYWVALDAFLMFFVPTAGVISLLLIYYVPRHLVPDTTSSDRKDIVEVITARNEIRKTYAQLLAGASFAITFLLSIYNFNRDFTQKAKQATAEQFSKAISQVSDKANDPWTGVGSFQALSEIARQNPYYHIAVHRTMARYLLSASQNDCKNANPGDTSSSYVMPARVQLVARIFADHETKNDDKWTRFDLEGACFSRAKLHDARGLQNLYMPGARLIGADFRNSNLQRSVLNGVIGGINHVEDWWSTNRSKIASATDVEEAFSEAEKWHWANFSSADLAGVHARRAHLAGAQFFETNLEGSVLQGADLRYASFARANLQGADLGGIFTKLTGASFENANLVDAQLADADFGTADLRGVDLTNANVRRADFTRAQNLNAEQLLQACIWPAWKNDKPTPLHENQPLVPASMEAEIRGAGGIRHCQDEPFKRALARARTWFARSLSSFW